MNKPTKFITGMLVMALVFGMAVVGCDQDGGGGSSGNQLAGTTWEVALPASATGGQSGYKLRLTFAATTVTRAVIDPDGNSDSEAVPYTLSENTITVEGDVWTISGNTISVPNVMDGETLTFTKVQ